MDRLDNIVPVIATLYGADFGILLKIWESAVKFYGARAAQSPEPLEIATILGWTRRH
jgi:hypothetical protein